ncbi:MAG: hypothetical protein OM95_04260 [Bdellovibrio sp. ArHS]|uniref:alpha/beta hydrolase family esterase n=1 Tax=Bdellovibrio sp. ArHS TaxID=1569284 RepID=UPI0005828505|nr:hypothetical protein [Bdellovibrio sp. ArHS]KHD89346.1 MAG: hypothetical protein OM95_04260 [Bdellovibrio sp. ArHS]
MQKIFFISVLVYSLSLSSCTSASSKRASAADAAMPLPVATLQKKSLTHQGRNRTYWLAVPQECLQTKTCPIVLAFHGGGGNGKNLEQRLQLAKETNARKMILILPDGVDKNWNDGRPEINAEVDDVGFVDQILMENASLRATASPVFLMGLSNGGQFVLRLACEQKNSRRFKAFATVVSNFGEDLAKTCHPAFPTSGFLIFGDKDPIMPFHGGPVKGPLGWKNRGRVISADETARLWLNFNKCQRFTTQGVLDENSEDRTSVSKEIAVGCSSGVDLKKWVIRGGGHGFPGAAEALPERFVGVISKEISAANEIFNFFEESSHR